MEHEGHRDEASAKNSASPHVELAVMGDVGCGKSTLLGHLIYKTGCADPEASGCITAGGPWMQVASRTHADALCGTRRRFSIVELAGSKDDLRRLSLDGFMTTNTDAALFVVSAAPGDLERNLSNDGCLREHALLARVLGVSQLVIAVTKLDMAATAYGEHVFEAVRTAVADVLRALEFPSDVLFVPVSGLLGDNLTEPSLKLAWFSGPTLLQALDSVAEPQLPVDRPLRVSVREVYHLDTVGAVAAGQVHQGALRVGTQVQLSPGRAKGTVSTVEVQGVTVQEARPRDLVTFAVEGLTVADLRRGMVAAEAGCPAPEVESFLAHVTVLRGPGDVCVGFSPVLTFHAIQVTCCFEELIARLDRRTAQTVEERPVVLRAGDIGLVRIRPEQPLCAEAYSDCPQLGQFTTTRDQAAISLFGVVLEVTPRKAAGAEVEKQVA